LEYSRRSSVRTSTAQIAAFVPAFTTPLPDPNPLIDEFRCRLDHDPPIPSVSVAARSGPASPRTAAESDVLPPALASSNAHVFTSRPLVFTSRCCKLVSDQLSIRLGNGSRRHKLPKLYASRLSAQALARSYGSLGQLQVRDVGLSLYNAVAAQRATARAAVNLAASMRRRTGTFIG